MKKLAITLWSVAAFAVSSDAQVISQWTFETNPPADLTDSATGPSVAADVGNGTATGLHASTATDWTTPAGNGSANALSANNWAVNDYFQFSLSTVSFSNIYVTFSQFGSATGPRDFSLQYSTTGTGGVFSSFQSYTVASTPGFTTGTYQAGHQYSFNLSGISALNNNANVVFRLVDTSAVAINGGTVSTAGTSRVDDFYVSANDPVFVPEPGTYMLLGVGGLLCGQQFLRRKKS